MASVTCNEHCTLHTPHTPGFMFCSIATFIDWASPSTIADPGGQVSVLSPDNHHQYQVMCLDTQWQIIALFMVDFAYFTIDNSTILVFR